VWRQNFLNFLGDDQNVSREFVRRSFLRESLSKTALAQCWSSDSDSAFKFRRNIAQAAHDTSEFLR
jgi:hypothetical protein